ncbi:hypothetical protein TWF281_000154 [Arthrobotrys megalospora]
MLNAQLILLGAIALKGVAGVAIMDDEWHLKLLKRQAPGTPAYNCHDNCGQAITASRRENHCDDNVFNTNYANCLQCSGPDNYNIWRYYGFTLTGAGEACGLSTTPLSGKQEDVPPALPAGGVIPSGVDTTTAPPATTTTAEPTVDPTTTEPPATTDEPEPTEPEPTVPPTTTAEPTVEPTVEPTEEPTAEPTEEPTAEPTEEPTAEPTEEPTAEPTEEPTAGPTENPTGESSTAEPTVEPTYNPTSQPTYNPPTYNPTVPTSKSSTDKPTVEPTYNPPTYNPPHPTYAPSSSKSAPHPTYAPSSYEPPHQSSYEPSYEYTTIKTTTGVYPTYTSVVVTYTSVPTYGAPSSTTVEGPTPTKGTGNQTSAAPPPPQYTGAANTLATGSFAIFGAAAIAALVAL